MSACKPQNQMTTQAQVMTGNLKRDKDRNKDTVWPNTMFDTHWDGEPQRRLHKREGTFRKKGDGFYKRLCVTWKEVQSFSNDQRNS